MYEVGVCGHFAGTKHLLNGQTVKTRILTDSLIDKLGSDKVMVVDTHGWKSNPLNLLKRCYQLAKRCKNIVIMPAHNGVRVFIPLFLLLNKLYNRKLHYVVIGGWLPLLLEKNHSLSRRIRKFHGVYVETKRMISDLNSLGINNVKYLPNLKRLEVLTKDNLVYSATEPLKLCTFSRVMKEKGVEDAVEAVTSINRSFGKIVYTLDIYGQIDENYLDEFLALQKKLPDYITYKGSVDYHETVPILKEYFAVLFPTKFKTEGIPGTIIDAYAAGVPVIASNWDSANEIIVQNGNKLVYDFNVQSDLINILDRVAANPDAINSIKTKCILKAQEYLPERVIYGLIKYF